MVLTPVPLPLSYLSHSMHSSWCCFWSCCLIHRGWFYHKAVWLILPGGKKVVLTARVYKPLFGQAEGELVLLEMPKVT